MNGFRQWVLTLLAVAAVLAVASMLQAGQIWNINGTFAPSLANDDFRSFHGTMEFPGDTVQTGIIKLDIDGEPLVREAEFSMALNMPGSLMQPWDTRMYVGVFKDKPWTMLALDYDMEAGSIFASDALQDGGGWDAWLVSFPDLTAGSISYMGELPQVNEPSAMALAALGFVVVFGIAREASRR